MVDKNYIDWYICLVIFCRIIHNQGGNKVKSTGIVRKVDELGRVVLPIELRRTFGISEKDGMEIFIENDRIILRKYEPACIFCGSADNVTDFRGKNVCEECLSVMSQKTV